MHIQICTFKCVFYLKQVLFTSTKSKFSTNWDESDYSVGHKIIEMKTQKYTIQLHFPSGLATTRWCGFFYSQFLCSQLLGCSQISKEALPQQFCITSSLERCLVILLYSRKTTACLNVICSLGRWCVTATDHAFCHGLFIMADLYMIGASGLSNVHCGKNLRLKLRLE